MTMNKFIEICNKYTITPEIALENENILEALKNKEYENIEKLICQEF